MTVLRMPALCLICMLLNPAAHAEPLGRLFFTPEQRAMLDRQRNSGRVQEETAGGQDGPAILNGLVRRSTGRNTTWINGIENPGGMPPGVRVGEAYAPDGGDKRDLLNGGSLTIRRSAPGTGH